MKDRQDKSSGIIPIRRQTFRDQIVESMRCSILRGDLPPGSQIVEAEMAHRFNVSRGPLREALAELFRDGLLVQVPYTGTHVVDLSIDEVQEIFSLRTELEIFAFRELWTKRGPDFSEDLNARHERLLASVKMADGERSIIDELALHSLVYENCGHRMLQEVWQGLRGKLQLYWTAHHRAHGRRGIKPEGHKEYVACALGDDFDAMIAEIRAHMARGLGIICDFLTHSDQAVNGPER